MISEDRVTLKTGVINYSLMDIHIENSYFFTYIFLLHL